MSLASTDLVQKLMTGLTSTVAGNEAATLLNKGAAAALASNIIAGAIVATTGDDTTDFGSLLEDDVVVHIPAIAGNAIFSVCATSGTLAEGNAVVSDLYVLLRAIALPADSVVKFP